MPRGPFFTMKLAAWKYLTSSLVVIAALAVTTLVPREKPLVGAPTGPGEVLSCKPNEGASSFVHDPQFKKYYRIYLQHLSKLREQSPELVSTSQLDACFAPGTPLSIRAAHYQAMLATGFWPDRPAGLTSRQHSPRSSQGVVEKVVGYTIVPDGTSVFGTPSKLVSTLDMHFAYQGSRAQWLRLVEGVGKRWHTATKVLQVSRYMSASIPDFDDGAAWPTSDRAIGKRGPCRIAGVDLDGPGNLLGYAFFPPTSDILFDTTEDWGNPESSWRFLRNFLAHEFGHAVGIDHAMPEDGTKLMEPTLSMEIDGPQHDDVRTVKQLFHDGVYIGFGTIPLLFDTYYFSDDPGDLDGHWASKPQASTLGLWPSGVVDRFGATGNLGQAYTIELWPVGWPYPIGPEDNFGAPGVLDYLNSGITGRLQLRILARVSEDPNAPLEVVYDQVAPAGQPLKFTHWFYRQAGATIEVSSPDHLASPLMYGLRGRKHKPDFNVPPIIERTVSTNFSEGVESMFTVTYIDHNRDTGVDWSIASGPAGAQISQDGVVRWTPTEEYGNTEVSFVIAATDNEEPRLTGTKTFKYSVAEDNKSPRFLNGDPITINELQQLSYKFLFADDDIPANTMRLRLITNPGGVTVNQTSHVLSWRPSETQGNGSTYPIIVEFDDQTGQTNSKVQKTFNVTVNEVNTSPLIANVPTSLSVDEGTEAIVNATFSDIDRPNQTLTVDLVGAPLGATIAPNGRFSWIPSETQGPGIYSFQIRVTDNGPGSLSAVAPVTITVNEKNSAPTFVQIPPQSTTDSGVFTFSVTATDADIPTQSLTYELVSGPAGSTFNPTTRVFAWSPTPSTAGGSYAAAFKVSDGIANSTMTVVLNYTITSKRILGSVSLSGYIADLSPRNWTYSIKTLDGDIVSAGALTVDSAGAFAIQLTSVPAQDYVMSLDVVGGLRRNRLVSINAGDNPLGQTILPNGDINDDGSVDLLDYFILSEAYNSEVGNPNYQESADLNGDASVDLLDYFILSEYFGEEDDPL